jgi:prepilin-type N-terminal cleavage/methylation domain-containing protein
MRTKKKGFTLVEIMIVVLIIGLLAALAVPSIIRARKISRTNACLNNLRIIEAAKDQWAMEKKAAEGAAPVVAEVEAYMKAVPTCPAQTGVGGTLHYDYNNLGVNPTCKYAVLNLADHPAVLPPETPQGPLF